MGAAGKVFLVGAGPGDPELITAKGLRQLRAADIVLYDALVHPDQLAECKPGAELVFVGKRAGRVSERQADIHRQLVEGARAGKRVVRLKGGDPYLFGRGSEEAEGLAAAGVEFEVIPGVPSPLAATAYGGLSLTHRELASSVAYLTATESVEKDRSSHNWDKLATATQTLVIFMGMRKLESLMKLLVEHGRPADTPAAVIEWASLPRQRTVVGTVADIHERVAEAKLGRPALTIVGNVVRLRSALRWFDTKPLFGKRVLVTRASHQTATLARLLRDEAAQPVVAPMIRLEPPADAGAVESALRSVHPGDWALFTSANAVSKTFEAAANADLDARVFGGARICVIGARTGEALCAHGLTADRVATTSRAEGVLETLSDVGSGDRVWLFRAERAREILPDSLRERGADVSVVAVYRTMPPTADEAERIREVCAPGELDAVLFTSSSTVRHLIDVLGGRARARETLRGVPLFSIGPVTTDAADEADLDIAATSPEQTIESLVDSLRTYYANGYAHAASDSHAVHSRESDDPGAQSA